MKSGDSI